MVRVKGRISISRSSLNRAMRAQRRIARKVVERLALTQIANINRRLDRGLNVDDSRMPDYSESYASQREKRGRQTKVRDLQDRGIMRRDMHNIPTGETSEQIAFGSARAKELAQYNQNVDPWFGISPADQQELDAELRAMEQELKK